MKNITSIILLVISVAIAYFYVAPAYENIKSLKDEKMAYEEAVQASFDIENRLDELQKKYSSFRSIDLHRLDVLLPKEVRNSYLILEANTIAESLGLTISDIRVGDSSGNRDQDDGLQLEDEEISKGPSLKNTSLSFSIESSYVNFQEFLKTLEENLPFYDITSLSFGLAEQSEEEGEESLDSNLMRFDVAIRTYYFN